RNFEADHERLALFIEALPIIAGQAAGATIIAMTLADAGEFFGRLIGAIGHVVLDQPVGPLLIVRQPLTLDVGCKGAANIGAFIPVEACPAQPVHDAIERRFLGTLTVCVLDTQDELAAMPTSKHPVELGGTHAADVQIAGWRGRESDADWARV